MKKLDQQYLNFNSNEKINLLNNSQFYYSFNYYYATSFPIPSLYNEYKPFFLLNILQQYKKL